MTNKTGARFLRRPRLQYLIVLINFFIIKYFFCQENVKILPSPRFFILQEEDFRKVNDTEGRVSEPLECGHDWILWGTGLGIKDSRFPKGLGLIPKVA